jgi:hypothetical protein
VITSWQIIVVTVALVIYFSLVSYVSRMYHPRRGFSFDSKPRKSREKAAAAVLPESSDDDDLGIED